jgi:GNAT superfamily N-acetyltransferase
MEIRPPHKPNYPAIADLLGAALGDSWTAEGLAGQVMGDQYFDPNLVFMAREKGEMLGFLVTVIEGQNAWVKLVAVHPSRRRQGLAREMLERAEERLFGEGVRQMRAGFGPGPLFFPGVPEGEAAEFFKACGYTAAPGGVLAGIDAPPSPAHEPPTAKIEFQGARSLVEATAPLWWSEVEERLTFSRPRLAMSADAKAICLADPGVGIGPLFSVNEASADQAIQGALAAAGAGRRLADFRGASWWQRRLGLSHVRRCFEFQKDLRGVFHA